jgi:hypothetical protein
MNRAEQADQHVGAQAGGPAVHVPLQADQAAQEAGGGQADQEVGREGGGENFPIQHGCKHSAIARKIKGNVRWV